jgi:UDP-3-O-[3-hydroxymyristoyl] N-acetylglucosamine deacetylase
MFVSLIDSPFCVSSGISRNSRKQKTIACTEAFSGIGIHSGAVVSMRFCPAKEDEGIYFRRTDLPGQPVIPAALDSVYDTSRSTNLAFGDARLLTVEHVLAAVRAFEIDNLCIEISGGEPPAGNGSSDVFVEMIERAGVIEQDAFIPTVKLKTPIYLSEGNIQIVGLPSDEYRISYTLHYPQEKMLGSQFYSVAVTTQNFKRELAPCRTFALYKEVSFLIDRGLIKGASLENAVVIKDDAILSKGGLYFPDEMARHKVLDLVGDLSLIGMPFTAHIIAIASGHSTNVRFAQKLYHQLSLENT